MLITQTKIKTVEVQEFMYMQCDSCKIYYNDPYEVQEFYHVEFVGGYKSIFGDMTKIECDICQHCLKHMLRGIYREQDSLEI